MTIAPFIGHAKRGFTLIELLVVIAIIGILSSVVLASLNTARSKGTDAKIQSEMRSVAVNAEIYYDNHAGKYQATAGTAATTCTAASTMFSETSPNIVQIMTDLIAIPGTMTCGVTSTGDAYAITHVLTATTSKFCVDSTGKALITDDTFAAGATACPTAF